MYIYDNSFFMNIQRIVLLILKTINKNETKYYIKYIIFIIMLTNMGYNLNML